MNVELSRSLADWKVLEDQWDSLLEASTFPSIFMSFDYLVRAYTTFHAKNSEPFILTVRNAEGVLLGIAPFRRSVRRHWGVSQSVLEYLVTWETDKPYIIARIGHEETVWRAIFNFLDANPADWDRLELIEMPDFLQGPRTVEQVFQKPGYRCQASPGPDGPCVDLTQSWEQFLSKHKKYRLALNRLDQQEPHYEVMTYDGPDKIGEGLERYVNLERRSWKHGRVGLEKNPLHIHFYQSVVPALAANNRNSIHILVSADGRELAGIICCSFEQTLYVQHTVYDPEFSKYSPGKLLMGLVLRKYMGHKSIKSADLLCGFANYYKPWASRIITTTNLQIVRMSPGMRFLLAGQWLKEKL